MKPFSNMPVVREQRQDKKEGSTASKLELQGMVGSDACNALTRYARVMRAQSDVAAQHVRELV